MAGSLVSSNVTQPVGGLRPGKAPTRIVDRIALQSSRSIDEAIGQRVFVGQHCRECADAEGLGRVVPSINDAHPVLLGVNGGPVCALADDESVDLPLACLL